MNNTKDSWIKIQDRLPVAHVDNCGNVLSEEVLLLCNKNPIYRIGFCRGNNVWETINESGYFELVATMDEVSAWMDIPSVPEWYEYPDW